MVSNPGAWADPAHVELLTSLWEQGRSATQIAAALSKIGGCYSRSACLGKIHRLQRGRIRADGRPMRAAPTKPGATPKQQRPSTAYRPQARVFGETRVPLASPSKPPRPVSPPEPVGDSACLLTDLTLKTCRWPLNSPGQGQMAETLFCGESAPDERPYCAHHSVKAVQPPERQPKGGSKALARSLRWATA